MKLGKFLADAGIASRRRVKELVLSGKVLVNGNIVESSGIQINPESDIIEFEGKRVKYNPESEKVYILLNKLPGYLSTVKDAHGEPTIMDLLPPTDKRLYPVGRLDKDTEGLIIITNDGDLTYRLTHPKHHIDKTYLAWVNGNPTEESLDKLRKGIMLEDGMTAPAIIERDKSSNNCIKIIIHEGRKRQIKRMFAEIGHEVLFLRRIQLGSIKLGNLRPGDYRYLSADEVIDLKKLG